ncbi:MAG: hypothetical protein ACO1OC_10820 [Tuberibacillus sp.]
MDITVSYILIRVIIGLFICAIFGYLQHRRPHFNYIYILLAFFVGSGIFCLFIGDEILYILFTIYFIFATGVVALVQFTHFLKKHRSEKNKGM